MTQGGDAVELEACPFCATQWEPTPDTDLELYTASVGWCVHCHGCGVETRGYSTRAEAIAAWNTRIASRASALDEAVEALTKIRRTAKKAGLPIVLLAQAGDIASATLAKIKEAGNAEG